MPYTLRSGDKNLKDVFREGVHVFLYRVWKLGRLQVLRSTGYWPRLHRRSIRTWNVPLVGSWMDGVRRGETLINGEKVSALRTWAKSFPGESEAVLLQAQRVSEGRFTVFDQDYDFAWGALPWRSDWRWLHTWPIGYFRSNRYYVRDKAKPFDVKFPWEISRLAFLIPLAQAAVITREESWQEWIVQSVENWERENPIAYSVNWCAMECAMRGIVLALVVQMLAAGTSIRPERLAPLLRQLCLQGEFLYRNIEYTKIRSNHYAANIVALLVVGAALRRLYPPANAWVRYAERHLFNEVKAQFCADGVNFERSVSYHRLVTELFLLATIQLQHEGNVVPNDVQERLRLACEYSRWYTRPDGFAPNWGDNDSAKLLAFDGWHTRCHKSLLDLAATFFKDDSIRYPKGEPSSVVPLLLGETGEGQELSSSRSADRLEGSRHFPDGGVLVSRANGNFLFADFGEVGTAGRGGHGHNDTFGFELALNGEPVLVDRGSPVYTGDLRVYETFRSTESHNVVRVDGHEMAELKDTWVIGNEAIPFDVRFERSEGMDVIEASHAGFSRLSDPLIHCRRMSFASSQGRLIIDDLLKCADRHLVEQYFYLAPGLSPKRVKAGVEVQLKSGRTVELTSNFDVDYRFEETTVSESYGHTCASMRMIASYEAHGTTRARFEIRLCQ